MAISFWNGNKMLIQCKTNSKGFKFQYIYDAYRGWVNKLYKVGIIISLN